MVEPQDLKPHGEDGSRSVRRSSTPALADYRPSVRRLGRGHEPSVTCSTSRDASPLGKPAESYPHMHNQSADPATLVANPSVQSNCWTSVRHRSGSAPALSTRWLPQVRIPGFCPNLAFRRDFGIPEAFALVLTLRRVRKVRGSGWRWRWCTTCGSTGARVGRGAGGFRDRRAGRVRARAGVGRAGRPTIRGDVSHLDQMRAWFGRPLWEMEPADADGYFGRVLRGAPSGTRWPGRRR